nr:MAG TPA: YopX protein [Caudoviricetes sp.]
MTPRYRAWDSWRKRMSVVDRIYIDTEGVRLYDDFGEYWRDFRDAKLMQSTGLRDKNGKEIFEGDIVKMAKDVYSKPTYYEVVRHRGGAYRLESKQHGCELWLRHTECEVVGNVYENKELMEAIK